MPHILQCCIFIFIHLNLVVSFVTHWLFGSMLSNIHIFESFTNFCYSFLICWRTYSVLFLYLTIFWGLFYRLATGLSWECSVCMHSRKMHILPLLSGVFDSCLLELVGLPYCLSLPFPVGYSAKLLFTTKSGLLKFLTIIVTLSIVYFSLRFCQFLLHVFWWYVVRCVYIYNCFTFLMAWPFTIIKSSSLLIFCFMVYLI